jgi:hypothetical protein
MSDTNAPVRFSELTFKSSESMSFPGLGKCSALRATDQQGNPLFTFTRDPGANFVLVKHAQTGDEWEVYTTVIASARRIPAKPEAKGVK